MTRAGALLLGVIAASVGAGCEGSAPQAPRPGTRAARDPRPVQLDALGRRFGRVRERMDSRGYRERRRLQRRFVLQSEGVAVPTDLPTGVCTTFVALGGGGVRELELTLYDGDGAHVAVDAAEGEGGLVHVCPPGGAEAPRTRPYYLVLRAPKGSGAVVTSVFESEPGHGQGFSRLFNGVVAPDVPLAHVEERLADSRAALRSRGFSPANKPRLERVAEGEVIRMPLQLDPGRCYAAIARGGRGLRDVDLFLYDPAGAEVARDLEGDAEPSLEHCPEDKGRYLAEVRAYEGAGAVGFRLFSGPAERPGEPPAAARSQAPDGGVGIGPRREDPVATVRAIAAQLTGRGYESSSIVRDVSITPGEVRSHDVLLGPGCGVVVGAGRPGMDLDLYLSTPGGEVLDRDTRVEPTARVMACPPSTGLQRVAIKAYGRDGPYALAVLRAPDSIEDVQSLRLEEATASFRGRGYSKQMTLRTSLGEGERLARTFQLAAGRCMAFAAAGDQHVEDLDLFLRSRAGQLVASESGPAPWAAVSRCAEDAIEALEMEVVLYGGEGEVAITRMTQHPQHPPEPPAPREGPSGKPLEGAR